MAKSKKTCTRWESKRLSSRKLGAGVHDRSCTTARTKKSCRIAPKDMRTKNPAHGWIIDCAKSQWNAKRGEWRLVFGDKLRGETSTLDEAKTKADGYLNK